MTHNIDVEAIKSRIDLRDLVAKYTTLHKTGRDTMAGPCPICSGNDRFTVYPNRCGCRKCHDDGTGMKYLDAIGFIQWVKGVDFLEAVAELDPAAVATGTNGDRGNGHKTNGQPPAPKPTGKPDYKNPVEVYDYTTADRQKHYRVKRLAVRDNDGQVVDKTFRVEHWDGKRWQNGKGDKDPVLYRSPELIEADRARWVWLPAGEKDVDKLVKYGQLATTNAFGEGNWDPTFNDALAGLQVVISEDNDEKGQARTPMLTAALADRAAALKVITPHFGGWDKIDRGDVSNVIEQWEAEGLAPFEITQRLNNLVANCPEWAPTPPDYTFRGYTLAELAQRPRKQWLIDQLVGVGDLFMVFGDAGSAKTLVIIDLAIAAGLGRVFADQFQTARPLKIAYCAGEGVDGLNSRFIAAVNKQKVNLDAVDVRVFTTVPQLFNHNTPETVDLFIEELLDQGKEWDLVILDTLHASSTGADENHSKDAGVILAAVKRIRDELGATVGLIHHANRSGYYRGSSALHGAMDTMLQTKMADGETVGQLQCFKQKDGPKFADLFFRLAPDHVSGSVWLEWVERSTITFDQPSAVDRAKEAIVRLLSERNEPLNQGSIIDALAVEVGRHSVRDALETLEKDGELVVKQVGRAKLYQLRMFE